MEEKIELKPCPFCDLLKMELIGAPKMMAFGNEIEAPGIENWHGFCVACGAEGPKEATLEAGIAAWNRRRSSPLPRARGSAGRGAAPRS